MAKNKKVIYTALVGDYDDLLQPKIIRDDYDYLCFSNDIKEKYVGVWQIKPIPYENKDNTRLSRYVKINPHKVLDGYEYSFWMDSNIQINDVNIYDLFENLIIKNSDIAFTKHPVRSCTYDECEILIRWAIDNPRYLYQEAKFLKKNAFPRNLGLYAGGLIFRKHFSKKIISFNEDWWCAYCKYSRRDQMSLRFVLWLHHIIPDEFCHEKFTINDFPGLFYYPHKKSHKKNSYFEKILKFIVRHYYLIKLKRLKVSLNKNNEG